LAEAKKGAQTRRFAVISSEADASVNSEGKITQIVVNRQVAMLLGDRARTASVGIVGSRRGRNVDCVCS
jgi:hypothetical protein